VHSVQFPKGEMSKVAVYKCKTSVMVLLIILQFWIFIYQLPPSFFCTQFWSLSIVEICM